jgi:predicted nucleotidyltransferase
VSSISRDASKGSAAGGTIAPTDRELLNEFARQVRAVIPRAAIWAFGSRARGTADAESDLDLCVVVPILDRDVRAAIYAIAWEVGFDHNSLLAPIILTHEAFESGPISASTLVAGIRRDGVAA